MKISKRYEKLIKKLFLIRFSYLSLVTLSVLLTFLFPNLFVYSLYFIFIGFFVWLYWDLNFEYQKEVEIEKISQYSYKKEKNNE